MNRKYWLAGAVGCFLTSGALVWMSASQLIHASALHRAAASEVEVSAQRQSGFYWMVLSVVVCGVGLGALVRYLVMRSPSDAA
jgi:hypothetical protein